MTHARKMDDHEGDFSPWTPTEVRCPKCHGTRATYRTWESSDGGWEDYQYQCASPSCRHTWWVDGIDS